MLTTVITTLGSFMGVKWVTVKNMIKKREKPNHEPAQVSVVYSQPPFVVLKIAQRMLLMLTEATLITEHPFNEPRAAIVLISRLWLCHDSLRATCKSGRSTLQQSGFGLHSSIPWCHKLASTRAGTRRGLCNLLLGSVVEPRRPLPLPIFH